MLINGVLALFFSPASLKGFNTEYEPFFFFCSGEKTVGTIFYFTVTSHLNDLPSLLRYLAKETPEKFWPKLDSNPDLCDAGAVLPQLSYGANWEQVIICVKDKAVDSGCMRFS